MKGFLKALTLGVSAVALTTFTVTDADAQKRVRWKMHAAFAKTVAVIGPPPHRVAEDVKRMSDGRFDIRVFEPGALTGGYAYFDPVSQGAIDAAYGTPGANQGKNSAYRVPVDLAIRPGLLRSSTAWLIHGGGIQIAEELYGSAGIKYILLRHDPARNLWLVPRADRRRLSS
jgi:TRAP-type mannitol/chloroaromatic compound transport system substrate-binding protein